MNGAEETTTLRQLTATLTRPSTEHFLSHHTASTPHDPQHLQPCHFPPPSAHVSDLHHLQRPTVHPAMAPYIRTKTLAAQRAMIHYQSTARASRLGGSHRTLHARLRRYVDRSFREFLFSLLFCRHQLCPTDAKSTIFYRTEKQHRTQINTSNLRPRR